MIFGEAVSAWQRCIEIAGENLRIDPVITSDNTIVDITVRYTGAAGAIKFYGVKSDKFSCTTTGPDGPISAADIAKGISYNEIGVEAISIYCKRAAAVDKLVRGETMSVLEKGTIAVRTAQKDFVLHFPEEYDVPLPVREAKQIGERVNKAELSIAKLEERLSLEEGSSSRLQSTVSGLGATMRGIDDRTNKLELLDAGDPGISNCAAACLHIKAACLAAQAKNAPEIFHSCYHIPGAAGHDLRCLCARWK
ncbi:hypothetical protein ACDY97_26845 [Rhizobium mongolense]|uniref:hypothetical protein n=1 Tax=Rhizobium mongolense TaxID=57676 RepID=UPI003558A851